jgi:hypothetical protein
LTLGARDFLCFATVGFFGATLRATAFFGTRLFAAAFFLTTTFFVDLGFAETFTFWDFRAGTVLATALFAFGRTVFDAVTRFFAADLGAERRVIVRDVERLKPLVTALISKVMIERAIWTGRSGSCRGRVT